MMDIFYFSNKSLKTSSIKTGKLNTTKTKRELVSNIVCSRLGLKSAPG